MVHRTCWSCLLLLLLACVTVTTSRCRWRFDSCRSQTESNCTSVIRLWCQCSDGNDDDSSSEDNVCPTNKTRAFDLSVKDEKFDSSELFNGSRNFCHLSSCTINYDKCEWQPWLVKERAPCDVYRTEKRKRYRCCHPTTKKPEVGLRICRYAIWDSRRQLRPCPDDEKEEEGLEPFTKAAIVIACFTGFLIVAGIIGKKVGRPICERQRARRRSSLPIVLQLPERRSPPKSAFIPQPGQPLPSHLQPINTTA